MMGGENMFKEECQKVFNTGMAVATFAKKMGRDTSTLYKWLHNEREISDTIKDEVRIKMKEIQQVWANCNFDID